MTNCNAMLFPRRLASFTLVILGTLLLAAGAHAQSTGSLAGTVRDADSGESLPGANVVLADTELGTSTNPQGRYRIEAIPAGSYTVRVSFVGYEPKTENITITGGETTTLTMTLRSRTFVGDEIVVTGSKRPEKILDSPVQVEAISADELATTGGGTFLAALGNLKGVDFVDVGINGQGISARGFNNHFNTRMLSMVDGRLATLPGTGLPQGNFLPTSQLDVQAIEVVVGPASALYGPNAHTGVVNVITKDPWDQSGVALDMRGGSNQLLDVNGRIAGTVNDRFGWKVTGQFMNAEDYTPQRADDVQGATTNQSKPHYYGTTIFDPVNGTTETVNIYEEALVDDYDVKSVRAEGGLYYRFLDDWQAELTAGFSENDNLGLTNNGRNRILGWQVNYQNLQVNNENWYAQVTRTANDAGDTYQINGVGDDAATEIITQGATLNDIDLQALRDDNTFTDKGELLDSEIQYRNTFGSVDVTTGVQARKFNPDSEGTFLADGAGQDIDATEVGGYLQLDYRTLDDRLRLNAAARVDDHSDYGTQFSPKAAVVYAVVPNHNVRVGYNRAFKSPTVLESNLKIGPNVLGNIDGYTVRSGPTSDAPLVREVDALEPEQVNSLEVGYKGVFGRNLFVDFVAYNSWYENFISPLTTVANPFTAGTYAFDDGGNLIADGAATQGFLLTYFNFGEATVRGFDLGLNVYANEFLNFTSSVSYIDLYDFSSGDQASDLLLNVPAWKLKGSTTVRDVGVDNAFVSVTGRWQSEFAFGAGYWNSATFFPDNDGEVPSRFTANLTAGYSIPAYGISIQASVSNLFDTERVDVLGSPVRERLIWLGATYTFDGLDV